MSRSNVKTLLSIASVLALAPFAVGGGSSSPPAVVEIRIWTGAGMAERATGTVIGDGRVLTVAHALEGARRVEVLPVGGERAHTATIVRRDAALDLALLRVPVDGAEARFGEGRGDLRVLTGRGSEPAKLRRRIDARLVDQPGTPRRPSLELAADIVSGDSGAPVVNGDGEIAGIVYARSTRRGGTAYAARVTRSPVERGTRR